MKNFKAFVVNLPSAVERRRLMVSQLEQLGIEYEIIEAIEGSKLSPQTHQEIDWQWAEANAFWIPKGLLACTLSHLKACKAIVEQQLDFGLILEDDTYLHPDLRFAIAELGEYLQDGEVIMLYYGAREVLKLDSKQAIQLKNSKSRLLQPQTPHLLINANAYLLTPKTVISMLNFQTPVKATSDSWGIYLKNHAIQNIRCTYPMLAEAADLKSTIDYVDKKSFGGKLTQIIDRYKLFPFYQILKQRRMLARKKKLNFEIV